MAERIDINQPGEPEALGDILPRVLDNLDQRRRKNASPDGRDSAQSAVEELQGTGASDG